MVAGIVEFSEGDIRFILDECKAERRKNPPWFCEIQGTFVRFYRTDCGRPPHVKKKREAVGYWSRQSRANLLEKLNRIDYSRVGDSLFLTLTYPDGVNKMPYTERSKHRAVFARHVETALGRHVPMVWRIEWEERLSGKYTGKLAPHFHVMMFGVRRIPWQHVREWWRQSIGHDDTTLKTWVKRIWGEDGAKRYMSKYVSKYRSLDVSAYHNSGIEFGRHWGILRSELIPQAPVVLHRQLNKEEIHAVRTFASYRWKDYDVQNGGGFFLLGEDFAKMFNNWFKRTGQKNDG